VKIKLKSAAIYLCVFLILFVILAPFSWTVLTSMKSFKQLITPTPNLEILDAPWENYYKVLFPMQFIKEWETTGGNLVGENVPAYAQLFVPSLINTAIVALSTTAVCLVVAIISAYALVRTDFAGRRPLMGLYLGTRMIPSIVLILPIFIIFNTIHLVDTLQGLIAVLTAMTIPYTIFIVREYFLTIPIDMLDSARVDGATRLRTLWRIVIPLSLPGIVVSGIFAFMMVWDSFLVTLILSHTAASIQMPVVISIFVTDIQVNYGMMCAAAIIGSLPPIALTFIFQKYIMSGLMMGAVKG